MKLKMVVKPKMESKMKFRKFPIRIFIFVICVLLSGCNKNKPQTLNAMIDQTAESLQESGGSSKILDDEGVLPAGNSSSDWIAMTLSFSERKDAYESYLNRLEQYVAEQYEKEGGLHKVKATEYHRIALTMLALGGDPQKVQGNGKTIDLIADGTYQFSGETPGLQGSNGLIYALLTLDSKNYEVPENADCSREMILKELLTYQKSDGGFCLDQSLESDVDITAMALQALAPYREQSDAAEAIEKGLHWLSEQMTESSAFTCYGEENTESCAQVILAMCALGMDPLECEEFRKEQTVLDAMNSFRRTDGMYCHIKSQENADIMATYQALLALEAVETLRSEGRWIFDFSEK